MKKIRIASSDTLSTFYAQAKNLGDTLVGEGLAQAAEALVTTGSVINAEMTARGDAELGFMAANWVPRAISGADPFKSPVPVSIVTPLNAGPLFFVTKADAVMETVADLRGKRVAVGHDNSGMTQHARNIVRTLGWHDEDIQFAYLSTFDAGEALAAGEVAAQLSAPIPSVSFTALCSKFDVKVLRFSESEITTLCAAIPFYSPSAVPAEYVPGLKHDLPALGVLNVVVAAANRDPAFVEAVAAAFIRRASDLERMNPLFRGLTNLLAQARKRGVDAVAPGGIPLHPGAERAFRAAGLLA